MKEVLKKTLKFGFRLLLLPLYLWFELLARLTNEDSIFQSISQYLSLIPGKLGSYCRAAFYWWACPNTSDDIAIGFLTVFSHRDTTIEQGVYIGPQCNIGKCHIGENTLLGSGVHVLSGNKQHQFDDVTKPIQQQGGTFTKVQIGADCWIGNGSLVIADIAQHCIIASGSVVPKPVTEPYGIFGGNPAKLIKKRFTKEEQGNGERPEGAVS